MPDRRPLRLRFAGEWPRPWPARVDPWALARRTVSPGVPARAYGRVTTRSATVAASSWSWVTCTAVVPSSLKQPAQLDDEPLAQVAVERAERLVEHQQPRLGARAPGPGRPAAARRPRASATRRRSHPASPTSVEQLGDPRDRRRPRQAPCIRSPKATLPADVAVREQLVVLEHQPDAAPVRRAPRPGRRRPAAPARRRAPASPATTRSSVVLPQPLGPEHATISPSATVEVDAVEHARGRRSARPRPRRRARQNAHGSVAALEPLDGDDHGRGHHHEDGRQRHRPGRSCARRAGRGAGRWRPAAWASSGRARNDGRAELAERHGEREAPRPPAAARATIGRSTSRHTRAGRGAQHGGRLPQPGVDRAQHGQHGPDDERRCATSAWAIGTRIHDGPQVERRLVEGDEEPEADGHRRRAERQHQPRVEAPVRRRPAVGDGRRPPAPPTHHGEHGGGQRRSAASCAIASIGGDEAAAAGPAAGRAPGSSRARSRRRVANDRSTSTAERARASSTATTTEVGARTTPTGRSRAAAGPVSAAGRSREGDGPALLRARPPARGARPTSDELEDGEHGGRRAGRAARRSGGRSRPRAWGAAARRASARHRTR